MNHSNDSRYTSSFLKNLQEWHEYNFRNNILEQQEILGCFIHIQEGLKK